jgi:hypothetical protein
MNINNTSGDRWPENPPALPFRKTFLIFFVSLCKLRYQSDTIVKSSNDERLLFIGLSILNKLLLFW